jgi:hypothetical protein
VREFISEHRFRLALALCAVALAFMIGAIYATTGFNLTWNASPGSSR